VITFCVIVEKAVEREKKGNNIGLVYARGSISIDQTV